MASLEEIERILTGASLKEIPFASVVSWNLADPQQEPPELCFSSPAPRAACARLQAVVLSLDATLAVLSLTDREHWK